MSLATLEVERHVKTLTRSMVRHAHLIAREVGAKVILLHADVVEADSDLSDLIQDVGFRVILVSRRPGLPRARRVERSVHGRPAPRHRHDPHRPDQGRHPAGGGRTADPGRRPHPLPDGRRPVRDDRHDHGPRHGDRDRAVLGIHGRPAAGRRHADRLRTRLDPGR